MKLRRLVPLTVLAAGLAVLAWAYHGELVGWIAGDRDAIALGDEPVAFYTCPMDPSVESDHPGPCPICGMALTPVSKEDRTSGVVRLTAAAQALLGLVVTPAETRPMFRRVVAAGQVVDAPPAAADRASITARVYRGDPRDVQPGQAVNAAAPESPLLQYVGVVEPARPTDAPGELHLVVDDPGHALHPGMRVEAELDVPLPARLVIPAAAVIYAGPRRIAFVERGHGRFEPRTLKLGITASGLVEVLDGLAADDQVVVKGTFLLAAESRLRSDGSLWGDLSKPVSIKRAAPKPASAPTPAPTPGSAPSGW